MVSGEILMRDGQVTVIDEIALYDECRSVIQSLRERAGLEHG
jgi:hypothetical protein